MNKQIKNLLLDTIEVFLISITVFVLTYLFLGQLLEVNGDSMYPTLHNKEQLIAEKLTVKMNPPKRGDIVIFNHPLENKLLVKRVIALPGEKILIKGGDVYINGTKLVETYVNGRTYGKNEIKEGEALLVPDDYYILLGDNRENSSDSRQIGPIRIDRIVGKALLVYYPLKDFRLVKH